MRHHVRMTILPYQVELSGALTPVPGNGGASHERMRTRGSSWRKETIFELFWQAARPM